MPPKAHAATIPEKRVTRSALKASLGASAQKASVTKAPAQKAPAKKVSSTSQNASAVKTPAKVTDPKMTAAAKAPAKKTAAKPSARKATGAAAVKSPAKESPVKETSGEETSSKAPANEAPVRETPVESAVPEKAPHEETPADVGSQKTATLSASKPEAAAQPPTKKPQSKKRKAEETESKPKPGASRKAAKASQKDSSATTQANKLVGSKIFVGQLPWKLNDERLATIFAQVGPVKSAHIPMDQEKNRSRSIGFVEFESVADAKKALETMQQHKIDGRKIRVDAAAPEDKHSNQQRSNPQPRNLSSPSAILFVGKLSKDARNADVYRAFSKYGKIVSIRMPENPETGELKGFAHVEFCSVAEAEKALKERKGSKGVQIKGKTVLLDFAPPRPSKVE